MNIHTHQKNASEDDDIIFEETEDENVKTSFSKSNKDVVTKIKESLKKCEEEKKDYLNKWQRSQADFINIRKRDEETKKNQIRYAKEGIVLDLLPIMDSFEMAFSNKEVWESTPKEWRTGIESIHTQLSQVLASNQVDTLEALRQSFNPNEHEALGILHTTNKKEDGMVLEVIQSGYVLDGKIIRAAKVRVGEYSPE